VFQTKRIIINGFMLVVSSVSNITTSCFVKMSFTKSHFLNEIVLQEVTLFWKENNNITNISKYKQWIWWTLWCVWGII